MAVTLQLAQVTRDELSRCRGSAADLNRLVCYETPYWPADHLDLDWAYAGLIRLCELADLDAARLAPVMRRALDGDGEFEPEIRAGLDLFLREPVSYLEPAGVAEVSKALLKADPEVVLAALPAEADRAQEVLGLESSVHPQDYLGHHLRALRDFYATAAERGRAVVLWWD